MRETEQFRKEAANVLAELTNHLLINGSMVIFPGLLYGKLGISLYFFHYWRYASNSLYREYALYLIDLVKLQIQDGYQLDYDRGLSGMGVGFDYLKQNGYYDVGDDFMLQIDAKIIKALSYERSLGLLVGFGRYLLTRLKNHPSMRDSLIQLADLLINQYDYVQKKDLAEKLSLLYDLYMMDIEKEKIEQYLSGRMNSIMDDDVRELHISDNLITLIKLSRHSSFTYYYQTVNEVLSKIISPSSNINDIKYLQWVLLCKQTMKDTENESFMQKSKERIEQGMDSYTISQLKGLFSKNNDFEFQGGYAGLGLVLMTILSPDNTNWTKLLRI